MPDGAGVLRGDALRLSIGGERRRENPHGVAEVVFLQDVRDADLVEPEARGDIEAAGGGDHDGLPAEGEVREEPGGKVVAVLNGQARDEIEGPLGLSEENAGDLRELLVQRVAPLLV